MLMTTSDVAEAARDRSERRFQSQMPLQQRLRGQAVLNGRRIGKNLSSSVTICDIQLDNIGDHAKLWFTRRENFETAVAEALRELLEKHLFQSVYVKTEDLLKEIPKRKRISKKLPPNIRMLASVVNEWPRKHATFENLSIELDAFRE